MCVRSWNTGDRFIDIIIAEMKTAEKYDEKTYVGFAHSH